MSIGDALKILNSALKFVHEREHEEGGIHPL